MSRTTWLQRSAAVAVACACAAANADTINSYLGVDAISGITVTPSLGSPNLTYTVTLDPGAYFTYGGTNYAINGVWGFDALAFGYNDLNQPALPTIGAWSDDSDHKPAGSTFGWKASTPNNGIQVGQSFTFTFPSLDFDHYTKFGFHVRLTDQLFPGTSGNTGRIYLIPAPGAVALLGLAGLVAGRRRRG